MVAGCSSLCLMETIGTVVFYWKGVPLYRQLAADPRAYWAHDETRLWSVSAIALIQVGVLGSLPDCSGTAAIN